MTTVIYFLTRQNDTARISVSIGPSGRNDAYLFNLDSFLRGSSDKCCDESDTSSSIDEDFDADTQRIASIVRFFRERATLHVLYGAGSNQHDQLLLNRFTNANDGVRCSVDVEEIHDLKQIVLAVPKEGSGSKDKGSQSTTGAVTVQMNDRPEKLYAGGGHSALLTKSGRLHLWGWNKQGQLGRNDGTTGFSNSPDNNLSPVHLVPSLGKDLRVEHAALGFAHTLVIEKGTGVLLTFGDNLRGQVLGTAIVDNTSDPTIVSQPMVPPFAEGLHFVAAAAGLHHSAAVTDDGWLVAFGDDGCDHSAWSSAAGVMGERYNRGNVGWWRPADGSRITGVACGRRLTVALDEYERVWCIGRNKYGQLGRGHAQLDNCINEWQLVDGLLGSKGSGCVGIDCGWSHCVALVRHEGDGISPLSKVHMVYGWGRNDKGQLGKQHSDSAGSTIFKPSLIHGTETNKFCDFCCGAESSMAVDESGRVWGCGWNEHGNLSIGNAIDTDEMTCTVGEEINSSPSHDSITKQVIITAGGGHILAMMNSD